MKQIQLSQIYTKVLDFFFPPSCLFCGRLLEEDEVVFCRECEDTVPWTRSDSRREGKQFHHSHSALFYTDTFKKCFHRYKFQGHWHYSRLFGQWMWDCLLAQEPNYQRFDFITWTPLSFRRRMSRGYDQAERLAREVSKYSGIPMVRAIVKQKHIAPQSGTEDSAQRWTNVKNAYRQRDSVDVMGKRILLIDDIITTGATLEEASGVLREAGALEVCCLTLARSVVGTNRERS